jgi:hypothetical protein
VKITKVGSTFFHQTDIFTKPAETKQAQAQIQIQLQFYSSILS